MKKLLFIILLTFTVIAFADFEINAPKYVVTDENGNDVPNVTRSNSLQKAMEKIQELPRGVEYGVRLDGFGMTVTDDEPMPVSCPEGFTGIEPNCEPLPVTCELPYVLNMSDNQCYTSDETCQAAGWDKANADLKGCMNDPEPEPVCEAPRQWLPSDEQGEPDYCGCAAGQNYIEETNVCEPLDMGHDHHGLPVVDVSKNIQAAFGQSVINIGEQLSWYSPDDKSGTNEGDFRLNCNVSHMANDDPIVYPNEFGRAHHHTFFGNTLMYADADVSKADTYGNSTCNGGIANRSGYWIPSMIDTSTNTPLKPDGIGVYYKTQRADTVTVPPKGLRIIAKGFTETDFMCNEDYGSRGINEIIPCGQGGQLRYGINFPNCWDGVNLDSPDHMSHMAYVVWSDSCPASHPVRIPNITINAFYNVGTPAGTTHWRLASDPDGAVAGSSNHADWVNGWDEQVLTDIVNNCLKGEQDCHSDLIGDGRQMY